MLDQIKHLLQNQIPLNNSPMLSEQNSPLDNFKVNFSLLKKFQNFLKNLLFLLRIFQNKILQISLNIFLGTLINNTQILGQILLNFHLKKSLVGRGKLANILAGFDQMSGL